jgi:DNA-binding transcriptional MerR regulator
MSQEPARKDVYKTAEVCKAADVAPYVLKYWLTEFACLSVDKDKSPNRTFSAKEVAVIARIRQLLYDEGFTIAGAKKKIDAEIAAGGFESGGAKTKKAASAPAPATAAAAPVRPLAPAPPPAPKASAPSVDPKKIAKELRDIVKMIR